MTNIAMENPNHKWSCIWLGKSSISIRAIVITMVPWLCNSHNQRVYSIQSHSTTIFLWFSYCFPMVFLLFPYGFPMVFLWFSYGFPMVSLRFSMSLPGPTFIPSSRKRGAGESLHWPRERWAKLFTVPCRSWTIKGEHIWKIYGNIWTYMENLWKIYRQCMDHIWKTMNLWLFHLCLE